MVPDFRRALTSVVVATFSWVTPAEAVEHEVSAGAMTFSYSTFSPARYGGFVAYDLAIGPQGGWQPLRLGAGARFAAPFDQAPIPLEGFIEVQLAGSIGPWKPTAGPELGLSGFTRPQQPRNTSKDGIVSGADDVRPLYIAFDTAPLRFRSGRFDFSALDVQLGTTLDPPGRAWRLQVGLRVGATL